MTQEQAFLLAQRLNEFFWEMGLNGAQVETIQSIAFSLRHIRAADEASPAAEMPTPASVELAERVLRQIEARKPLQLRLAEMLHNLVVFEGVRLCD